jgi:isopenicillin-N epimerase
LIEPLIVSWGWEAIMPGPSRFVDEQEWQGTRDVAAYLAVPGAIQFLNAHHWEAVRAECHLLAQKARQSIESITGITPLSPDSPEWYAQMVSVPLPPCDAEQLKSRLYDEYHIEVPIVVWNDRTLIRISIQAYNTHADIDALVNALERLLPEVGK